MLLFIAFIILHFVLLQQIKDSISKFVLWSFFLVWSVAIIISQFGFYGLNIPKDRTILYISIHLLSFYAGFFIVNQKKSNQKLHLKEIESSLENRAFKIVYNKFFLALLAVLLLYVISLYLKMQALLAVTQSLGEVRNAYFEENLFGPYYYFINLFVLTPVSCLLLFVWGYMTLKKKNILWVVIGLFLFLYFSLGGGRIGYFKIFISLVLVWQIFSGGHKKRIRVFDRRTLYIGALGVALYFLIIFTTAARMGNVSGNQSFADEYVEETNTQLLSYYVGPIAAFDYALENDYVSKNGGYKYGALTFSSIEEILYIGVLRLNRDYKRPISEYSKLIQHNIIWIGDGITWNALFTWCLYFYLDLGVAGLILFPFIFGIIIRKIIFYCYNNPNLYSLSILCFFYVDLMISVLKYSWQSFSLILMLVFFFYMSNKSRKRIIVTKK